MNFLWCRLVMAALYRAILGSVNPFHLEAYDVLLAVESVSLPTKR